MNTWILGILLMLLTQVGISQKSGEIEIQDELGFEISIDAHPNQNTFNKFTSIDLIESSTPPIDLDWDWRALLEEPNYFAEGSSIGQIGIGFLSTVNVNERAAEQDLIDVEFSVPSLHLMYERQVWKNFGAGLSFGTQIWKVPILDYQYRYYTLGLRSTYHFNIMDKLDPYVALGSTFRRMVLANSDRNIAESKMTFHFVIGSRYYLTEKIGVHLEIGNDLTSWFKLGASYYMN